MSKFFIQGKGPIDVNQNDFISEGGEGKVFSKGSIVLKIYTDLKKMIPTAKIQELSVLSKMNNIIIPKDLLLDKNNQVVGYTMDYVKGVPMCKLFTNDFRNRNNVQPESINKLVTRIIETIVFIHDNKCLLIDGNEMNYMVDNSSFQIPYFIDVNGYQTPSFPATVIMPSIRDWSSKTFSELTDWYSFAIVSCQLFIGIHPFKGRHSKYKPNQLEDRMKNNISVFNKDVSVPSTCRDFSYIPDDFRNWYIKLFEKGERIPPPKVVGLLNIKQVAIKIVQTTNHFEISSIQEFQDEIVKVRTWNGNRVVTTKKQIFVNKMNYRVSTPEIDVVFTPKMMKPIFVKVEKGKLSLRDTKGNDLNIDISCEEKMVIGNTIFVKFEGNLYELIINEFGERVVPSVKQTWNIMPLSSQLFDNMIYQNVLGKAYIVIPHPEESLKNSSCSIVSVPELNGYRIIDGKYENKVCMLIGNKGSVTSKFILRFSEDSKYDCRVANDSTFINFTVLDNGISISINDDDTIEVFSNNLNSNKVNAIQDPDINQSMVLVKDGIKTMFFNQNKLYSLSMKNKK
jgi:hypothetical protein